MQAERKDPVFYRGSKDTTLEPPKPEDTLLLPPATGTWLQKDTRTGSNNSVLILLCYWKQILPPI